MKNPFYIGVDVGGTKIVAALVNGRGRILKRLKVPTPLNASSDRIYGTILSLIQEVISRENIRKGVLKGIGLGIPGIVRSNQKDILITPNISLSKYPLAEKLEKEFKVRILMGNDVNLGILAERWLGGAKKYDNIIGIFLGTGVGGGIIIDGKIYSGSQGGAGELGHMIIDQDSRVENAGVWGSLEALTSRRAIENAIRDGVRKKRKTIITSLAGGNLKVIRSSMIREALKRKDKLVLEVVDRVCDILGKACISLRHLFNPDLIIFGGGVIEACGDYMLPRITKISERDPFFKGIDTCQIVRSQLGDDAVLLGAVAILRQKEDDQNLIAGSYYPRVELKESGSIVINKKSFRGNIFIRADGKVKKIEKNFLGKESMGPKKVGPECLKRFCKKNPQVLLIGSASRKLELTPAGRAYLKTEGIEYSSLPKMKAVAMYNRTDQRKALLLLQASA